MRILKVQLLCLLCAGCLQSEYIAQAAAGQDEISYKRRPIDEVLADEGVSPTTRALLSLIDDVKRFGETHGLEPTDSYEDYVELDRPVVVYVVSASQPLRFESKTWWFPIVGSVPYLGWFDERRAQRFAAELAEEGLDVDVRGARAYSTLGWFADPILSTMIRPREGVVADTVDVVLHESVHATYYVNSQSNFNESLADWVAEQLTDRYLRERLVVDRWQLLAIAQDNLRRKHREKRFHEAYKELEKLYQSNLSDADKLAAKARIVGELRTEVDFGRPINNAVLASARTYHGGNESFARLFEHCGRDWARFWKAIKTIDGDSFKETQQADVEPVIARLRRRRC